MFAPPYEPLSRFAGNLVTCLQAGLGMSRSFKTARRALTNTRLQGAMDIAQARMENGDALSESLADAEPGLPKFFVPMIQAGEQTGRLDESLRYLEHHCKMLARPARALRNTWLIPFAVVLTGTVIKLVAHIFLAPWRTTLGFLFSSLTSYAMLSVIVLVAVSPPVRPWLHQLFLVLPLIASVERETAVNRFFHALAMLYAAAGQRVENMMRVAASTVHNSTLQADFLGVARQIERGAAIPEAFEALPFVSREQKHLIATGDVSGTLEQSFESISKEAGERLEMRLETFNQVFLRIMTFAVVSSVAVTLMSLLRFL
jgi:type II secretory pathway component PulF